MVWVINALTQALYPRERHPVPIAQEVGWTPWPFWTGAENLVTPGIQSADRPARNELLYRLRYSDPIIIIIIIIIIVIIIIFVQIPYLTAP
jgi:hypothetical protein